MADRSARDRPADRPVGHVRTGPPLTKSSMIMKVFLATVSQTNGRGPRCTEADQAGIEAPVVSLQLDDPLEEEDEVSDTAMVKAVSTVMNTVEVSNQALVGGPGQKQGSSFGQGATFKNCTFHFG